MDFRHFLPFLFIAIYVLVAVIIFYACSKQKKKMLDLAGRVNKQGEGVLSVDDRSVTVKYIPGSRNRSPELRLTAQGSFGADLVVRRESAWDTFWINKGLNRELPVSDQELAHKFYFECDVPEFLDRFLSNPQVKNLILDAMASFDFIEIRKDACTFRKYPSQALENYNKDVLTQAARDILSLTKLIPQSLGVSHPELLDFRIWSMILNAVSIGSIAAGFIFFIWASVCFRVVDTHKAWLMSFEAFFSVYSVAASLAFLKIRGFSTSSKVFLNFALFFAIGVLLCIRYGGAVYNGFNDGSSSQRYDQVIINKYTTTSKGATSYHLVAASWRQGMGTWPFQVTPAVYSRVRSGSTHCLITTKAGRLGFEWVVSNQVRVSSPVAWTPADYSRWYPLPGNINNMDEKEYAFWVSFRLIMEAAITNRLETQTALAGRHTGDAYRDILGTYERKQRRILDILKGLDTPPRLQVFKDEVISAGEDQITYYEGFTRAKINDVDLSPNAWMNDPHLRASDQKLHDADKYFKSLYPSMDKATNDAIERRVAWFDII